uniref:Cytochrome c biogenesis protein CcsA n=1 Tax=Aureoumbra lagunensis TaxID=44058 RepID=C6KJ30_9STRA|nr:cytochrome c biogenesis protein [Aureoumbra lagunensis]ACS36986.1 cytochrome c biogenesis protein [Aureoumbra lagunensis]
MIFVTFALLLSSLLCWFSLIKKDNFEWINNLTLGLVIGSNVYLFIFLGVRWIQNGYFPLSNLYESLIFLTWCLTTVQLIASRKTSRKIIGSLLTPIEGLVLGFASFLPKEMQVPAGLVPALQSNWLMFHVSMMIVSYATLILGSLLSVLLLILILRSAKNDAGTSKEFISSPQLALQFNSVSVSLSDNAVAQQNSSRTTLMNNLDIWSYRTIGFGHIALTLGILAGAVWANEAWGSYWSWDPKETWSLITWLVFTAYLHARLVKNWRGLETALIGTIGFVSIWISYLGVNFLASGLHSYGWVK